MFLVYRDTPSGWICIEVGSGITFYKLVGLGEWRVVASDGLWRIFPAGPSSRLCWNFPFREVQANGGVPLDESGQTQYLREHSLAEDLSRWRIRDF